LKYLFFILLLLNGLFWLWQSYVYTPPMQTRTAVPRGAEQLVLLAERSDDGAQSPAQPGGDRDSATSAQPPAQQAEAATGTASGSQAGPPAESRPDPQADPEPAQRNPAPAAVARCYTIGPFREIDAIANARRRLADLGITSGQRVRSEREFFGYSVYLPPRASREDARALTRELRARGITDYYIMSDRELRNAVSLGLFRERRHAERLHRKVTALGFSPRLEPRYRERELRWLDYRDDRGRIGAALLREISPQGELQRLDRDC